MNYCRLISQVSEHKRMQESIGLRTCNPEFSITLNWIAGVANDEISCMTCNSSSPVYKYGLLWVWVVIPQKHIEATARWTPFSYVFSSTKLINFKSRYVEICWVFFWNPVGCKAPLFSDNGPVYWRICATLGLNVINCMHSKLVIHNRPLL